MELEGQWWKGQLAGDIYQALRYKGLDLTAVRRHNRLQWANADLRWPLARWRSVLFTDESRFQLYLADGRQRLWHCVGERFAVVNRVPHGGNGVMEIKLPSYKGQSPQLNLRRYFADLIAIVSNRYRLCPAARHLAVYLLDLFMDRYDITVQQLHMVALSCLLLASKFEEREDRVPKLETLNSLGCMSSMNLVLTKQGLLHMELLLLETFQWNLYLPTAAHFIEYYLSIAVNDADLHDGWPMACLEKTVLYMTKYADYFLEVSLQDHAFLRFAPSLVAAACVAASRIILRLSPSWPPQLQRLTAYSWDHLVPCVEKMLIAHDSDVKEANKQTCQPPGQQPGQTGYHTPCQTTTTMPPQYLHQSSIQYPQQALQPSLAPGHGPASYISHSATLQGPGAPPHSHPQTISAALDGKANIPSRAYQVNMHYTCAAPCFDR